MIYATLRVFAFLLIFNQGAGAWSLCPDNAEYEYKYKELSAIYYSRIPFKGSFDSIDETKTLKELVSRRNEVAAYCLSWTKKCIDSDGNDITSQDGWEEIPEFLDRQGKAHKYRVSDYRTSLDTVWCDKHRNKELNTGFLHGWKEYTLRQLFVYNPGIKEGEEYTGFLLFTLHMGGVETRKRTLFPGFR